MTAGRGKGKPSLTAALILSWADAQQARTGRWPTSRSGPLRGAPGETWWALNQSLRRGNRGLPGGDTLARLLRRERGVGDRRGRPRVAPARLRRVLRLHARGRSLAEIARRLEVSPQAVRYLLHRAERDAGAVEGSGPCACRGRALSGPRRGEGQG
jgi:hypothetical protein